MSITLEKISVQSARAVIANGLRCTVGDAGLQRALVAEHIRSAIYANALVGAELNFPAALHSTRLLTSARKAVDLVWPAAAAGEPGEVAASGDIARLTLDALSGLGDIADTGGGYWVGTPLRFISSGETLVAMGSSPNAVIKSATGTSPICAGIVRIAEVRPSAERFVERVTLSVPQWLGSSEEIQTWTKRIFAQHEPHLKSGDQTPASQLEVFAPELLARGQRNPWVACQSISRTMDGLRLCRPTSTHAFAWNRPYYLARLNANSGELAVSSSVRVDYSLTRRLRSGIFSLSGVKYITATTNGELLELELPPGLPDPEARIVALGWPSPTNQKRLIFHRRVLPLLSEVLARLALAIVVRLGAAYGK